MPHRVWVNFYERWNLGAWVLIHPGRLSGWALPRILVYGIMGQYNYGMEQACSAHLRHHRRHLIMLAAMVNLVKKKKFLVVGLIVTVTVSNSIGWLPRQRRCLHPARHKLHRWKSDTCEPDAAACTRQAGYDPTTASSFIATKNLIQCDTEKTV